MSQISPKFPSRKLSGFTLVELIVVITILVILGTIAFINLGGFASSARDSRRVSDMSNITQSIELSVVTQGSAPMPTDAKPYTGGNVTIQMGTITNATIPRMSGDFSDPVTKAPYNYSIFGNGLYYQIGIDFENPLSYHTGIPGIETVYADNGVKYSKLSGSYKFDPSLPSLFFLTGAQNTASGGIFSPDVCFVLNNVSTNTFGSTLGCKTKKDMNLKDMDSSLVGYWDMETCTGTGGQCLDGDKLRDLSGNGNDGTFSGGMVANSAITNSSLGKALRFNGAGDSIIVADAPSLNFEPKDNFTIEVLAYIPSIQPYMGGANSIVEKWTQPGFNSYPYTIRYLNSGYSYDNSARRKITVNQYNSGQAFTLPSNTIYDDNFFLIHLRKTDNHISLWINGRFDSESINSFTGSTTNTSALFFGHRGGPSSSSFSGTIDDIKIYNRALSDDEIKQQAKIAGF